MGTFKAMLRLPGDSQPLPATVQFQAGRMQVASGDHVIGDWDIQNIEISRIAQGFRIAAEGEEHAELGARAEEGEERAHGAQICEEAREDVVRERQGRGLTFATR